MLSAVTGQALLPLRFQLRITVITSITFNYDCNYFQLLKTLILLSFYVLNFFVMPFKRLIYELESSDNQKNEPSTKNKNKVMRKEKNVMKNIEKQQNKH